MAEGFLTGIARRLYHDALARPGIKARHSFQQKAVASLVVVPENGTAFFELRIAREGVMPNGDKLAAWNRECETFCRAFLVPPDVVGVDHSYGAFYYRLYRWECSGNPFERVGGQHAANLL